MTSTLAFRAQTASNWLLYWEVVQRTSYVPSEFVTVGNFNFEHVFQERADYISINEQKEKFDPLSEPESQRSFSSSLSEIYKWCLTLYFIDKINVRLVILHNIWFSMHQYRKHNRNREKKCCLLIINFDKCDLLWSVLFLCNLPWTFSAIFSLSEQTDSFYRQTVSGNNSFGWVLFLTSTHIQTIYGHFTAK